MTQNSNRGFAAWDAERRREVASRGGRAAHRTGRAHEFNSQQAREAGRRGGEAVSRDRQHMAEIGARGGHRRHGNRQRELGQELGQKPAPAQTPSDSNPERREPRDDERTRVQDRQREGDKQDSYDKTAENGDDELPQQNAEDDDAGRRDRQIHDTLQEFDGDR